MEYWVMALLCEASTSSVSHSVSIFHINSRFRLRKKAVIFKKHKDQVDSESESDSW